MRAVIAAILMTASGTAAAAPPDRQQPGPPTTASAEVTQCAQAQMVVDRLLEAATTRMEVARQANAVRDLRAAVADLQGTLRDVRAQLAPCASLRPAAGPHDGHTMPSQTATPASPASPLDHSKMPMGTTPGPKPTPVTPTIKPSPVAKPPAADPHAGHAVAPTAKTVAPAAKPPTSPPPVGKSKKPEAPAAPMDHSKMPMGTPADAAQATDPVCGLKVDPATAPQVTHQGQSYYFCSEQHRQLFQKNPPKYLPKGQ